MEQWYRVEALSEAPLEAVVQHVAHASHFDHRPVLHCSPDSSFRSKRLWKNTSLRLTTFLAFTDFLHALTTLPYIIYLTTHWSPTYIDLDPYFIMLSSTPLTIHLKIYLTLTISIAFERLLALFFPLTYRKLPSSKYATTSLLIGVLLAATDLVLEFLCFAF
ncbi:hypothetical protein COOONC_07621 [Cooperia oncophora]